MTNEHALWLEAYRDQVAIAQTPPYDPGKPGAQLSLAQREAYMSLPDLIGQCKSSWDSQSPSERSVHYLTDCV